MLLSCALEERGNRRRGRPRLIQGKSYEPSWSEISSPSSGLFPSHRRIEVVGAVGTYQSSRSFKRKSDLSPEDKIPVQIANPYLIGRSVHDFSDDAPGPAANHTPREPPAPVKSFPTGRPPGPFLPALPCRARHRPGPGANRPWRPGRRGT